MSARVRVRTDRAGRLVAAKVAANAAADLVLVREAAVLVAARRPGVVAFHGLVPGADGLELVTGWVGTASLADTAKRSPAETARVVAALATTVAGLHADRIVHGGIDRSHVLIDDRGRPVLCSFGRSTLSVGALEGHHSRPADDVAALGALLTDTLGPLPEFDLAVTRRNRSRRDDDLHRGLLVLADHAQADDPHVRPTAAAFAAGLRDLAPDPPGESSTLIDDLERLRATARTETPRRRRGPALVGLAVAIVGGVLTLGIGAADRAAPRGVGPTDPVSTTAVPTTAVPTTSVPTTAVPTTPVPAAPVVDVDGARFEVGEPGDVVVVAPWRCDGRADLLLLRPRTGGLYLFADPAVEPTTSTVLPFRTIDGARTLEPVDAGDPCPIPVVVRSDGTALPVGVPAA